MSEDTNPEAQLGMPVAEVIAYLTEIAQYNQMIADRLVAQITMLGEALESFDDASALADSSTSDEG